MLRLLALSILVAGASVAQPVPPDAETQAGLRAEIEAMLALDQRVRYMNTAGTFDSARADSIGRVLSALPLKANVALEDSLEADAASRLSAAERDSLLHIQWRADLDNITRLREIVGAHGWPDRARIGGSSDAFILLLHTHPDTLDAMLPALRREVAEGRMPPRQYAIGVDKSRKIRGLRQLYGTGPEFDPATGALAPPRVDDIEATNAARAAIGLAPLAEFRTVDAPSPDPAARPDRP